MKKIMAFFLIASTAIFARPAAASTTYLGSSLGKACFDVVNGLALSGPSKSDLKTCTKAIESGTLSGSDLPATHVNRGIVLMRMERYRDAISDYERALDIDPTLAEAKVNMGAALIGLRRYGTAINMIKDGIALDPISPHVAYYNLGLAHELLGDLRNARAHYVTAAGIAPEWSLALRKLESLPLTDIAPAEGADG